MGATGKYYSVVAPVGSSSIVNLLDEKELRALANRANTAGDPVWAEKIDKDPIESVVEWLEQIGYNITIR